MFGLFRREARPDVDVPKVVLPQYAKPGSRRVGIFLIIFLGLFCFAYGFGFGVFAPARMVQFFFPLLAVAGLTVWALPELGKAPTTAIERLFFAFFIGLPLWPNYLAIALPGLPWITVQRIIGFPLVTLLLLGLSVAPLFRESLSKPLKTAPLLWKFVTAFAVLNVLSVAMSDAPQISLNKVLVTEVNWIAMFFIAVFVFVRPGRVELWGVLLCLMAFALSLLAIPEFLQRKVLWAGHIPDFLAVQDESVQRVMSGRARAGTDRYRVLGTYSTALGFSEFLALSTPFLLHFALGPYKLILRFFSVMALPLVLNGIILTDSRLGMVGFLMSMVLYVLCWGALRWRQNRNSILGPAIVLGYPAFAIASLAAILVVPRLRVMTLGGGQHQASNDARIDQVNQGIPLILKNPLGYGIGRGAEALGYTSPGGGLTIDTYWLLTALDYGVAGFVLFYGAFLIAVASGFRAIVAGTREREHAMLVPLTIALFIYVVIKSIYAGVENQSTMFMMLGAVVALVYRNSVSQAAHASLGGDAAKVGRRKRRVYSAGIA